MDLIIENESIKQTYDTLDKNDEFEVMFFGYDNRAENKLWFDVFNYVLGYIYKIGKDNIQKSTTLDIIVPIEDNSNYRLSILDKDDIMNAIDMFNTHYVWSVFYSIADEAIANKDRFQFIKKKKHFGQITDINDLNIRFRKSTEIPCTKNDVDRIESVRDNKMTFRYKERLNYVLLNDKHVTISIDLTSSFTTFNLRSSGRQRYELELDMTCKDKPTKKHFDTVMKETERLIKVIQQSNHIITISESNNVLRKYFDLVFPTQKYTNKTFARNTVSLEIQNLHQLPNSYAVTDKADGLRSFLLIFDNEVYLLTTNLIIKKTGIKLKTDQEEFNDSILDGEYIFLPDKKVQIFLVFDCLFISGKDIRTEPLLEKRLLNADSLIEKCFRTDNTYSFKRYTGNVENILEYHTKEISEFINSLSSAIKRSKFVVQRKYFIFPHGIDDSEVFKNAVALWDKFMYENKTYSLDGLIFQPVKQEYVIKNTKYYDYKWKPSEQNTIDFYIEFMRDDKGKIITAFDNAIDKRIKDRYYQICYLYVSRSDKGRDIPVLFRREGEYIAHLFVTDGKVLDMDGNQIQDKTVVEFAYLGEEFTDSKFRWKPIKTRYDKTDLVQKFNRSYGNSEMIANRVWNSINNPLKIDDLKILGDPKSFKTYLHKLENRIKEPSPKIKEAYYRITSDLAKPLRAFHNYIKTILINTYCSPIGTLGGKRYDVLDIGCGRGGDIDKFYYSNIKSYVGIDTDKFSLFDAPDSATNRYNALMKKAKNVPEFKFFEYDAGAPLTVLNKRTFDRINCQFAIHYFLKNKTIWENFCDNINKHLNVGGFMLITCFDSKRVLKLLKKTNPFIIHYTAQFGDRKKLFELTIPKEIKSVGLGNAINVYNAFISDIPYTEYLVDKDFLIDEFDKKCNLSLIETDTFEKIFELNEKYFIDNKISKSFPDIVKFYKATPESTDAETLKITKLNRYYIFYKN